MATNCTRHVQLKTSKGVGHQQTSPWRWFRRTREPPEALPSRWGPFHCHGSGCIRHPVCTHGGHPMDWLCHSSHDEDTQGEVACVGSSPPFSLACGSWHSQRGPCPCPAQMSPVQTGYLHPPVRVLVQAASARHTANMCSQIQQMSLRASNTGAGIGRCVAMGRCVNKRTPDRQEHGYGMHLAQHWL